MITERSREQNETGGYFGVKKTLKPKDKKNLPTQKKHYNSQPIFPFLKGELSEKVSANISSPTDNKSESATSAYPSKVPAPTRSEAT
jgi:hypothetical protein